MKGKKCPKIKGRKILEKKRLSLYIRAICQSGSARCACSARITWQYEDLQYLIIGGGPGGAPPPPPISK